MITKNNPSAYASLFEKANEILRTYGGDDHINTDISNIDEYFQNIGTLAELELNHPDIDPIFTILPTDEDTFDINANTREIKIPENFKKYGVGVKGDEIAEILYFSIDRYFDAMDLAGMNILIQWRYDVKNNSEIDTFLSATYKKSLTLKPGKIVFGWPITSEITAYAGNIQFSVRFYERDGDRLVYNFGTLPTTIKIQNSLNIELNKSALDAQIDKNDIIYNRLRNSRIISNEILAEPSFGAAQWVLKDGVLQTHTDSKAYDSLVPFVAKASYHKDTNSGFTTHEIQYNWNANENSGTSHAYYLEAQEYNPFEVYYKLDADGETYITETVGSAEAFENSEVQLYIKGTQFIPTKAGQYSVTAINRGDSGTEKTVPSYIWIITGPTAPTFTVSDEPVYINHEEDELATINIKYVLSGNKGETVKEDHWILTKASGETITLTTDNNQEAYIVEMEDPANTYCQTSIEGTVVRTVIVEKNNTEASSTSNEISAYYEAGKPTNVTVTPTEGIQGEVTFTVNFTDPNKGKDEITYQWSNEQNPIENAINSTFKPNEGGYYRCTVTNTYHNSSVSVDSNWVYVQAPPPQEAPTS